MTLIKPIKIRTDSESHRQATWLELFIDLAYVVGIASLSDMFESGFDFTNLLKYGISFFIIFWIWNRFTWYASYYDNDDIIYRLAYLISIFPTLGLVHSLEDAYQGQFANTILFYLAINLILIILWLRVLIKAPKFKRNTLCFVLGYFLSATCLLVALALPPDLACYPMVAAIFIETMAPIIGWYKEDGKLPVHTSHIVERYGLFSIILLWEGVVSISKNFELIDSEFWYVLVMGFLIVISNWWIYFDCGFGFKTELSKQMKRVFVFGYGQFLVFFSLVMISIAMEYHLHHIYEKTTVEGIPSGSVMTFSLGMFLLSLSLVQKMISNLNPKKSTFPA